MGLKDLFDSKEKKAKREEEAASAKADAEFQAKYTTKQERKKVEKMVANIDQSINSLVAKAAAAKSKGYAQMYQQCVQFIKVARARKQQAEMFLFQIDAMQEMKTLADNSSEILGSMSNIMNSLGKLSIDKTVMMNTQRDFAAAQRELDKQGANIDMFLSGMEMSMPDDASLDSAQFSDADIDAEIDSYIVNNAIDNADFSAPAASSAPADGDMAYLKQMLNS